MGSAVFPRTAWTQVRSARTGETPRRESIEWLFEQYHRPIYYFLRRYGFDAEEAADVQQDFFARISDSDEWSKLQGKLEKVSPEAGHRFRTFLVYQLKALASDIRRRRKAEIRGGRVQHVSLHCETDERRYQRGPSHGITPDDLFTLSFADDLCQRVMHRLKERYADRPNQFHAFVRHLAPAPPRFAKVAEDFELTLTEGAFRTALSRFKQQYANFLREELSQVVESPSHVEDELREILRIREKVAKSGFRQ